MEALTTAGWSGSGGGSRRPSWCERKEVGEEGGGGGRKCLGERFGGNGEVERRRDSGSAGSCVRREVSDNGNQIIDIRPSTEEGSSKRPSTEEGSRKKTTEVCSSKRPSTEEGSKSNSEKRQEVNPEPAVKKAPSWNQGGLRDTVHDIITVGLAKVLRLKLKRQVQVTEVVTVSVSPPPSSVEPCSPCKDHQRPGSDSHLIIILINFGPN